MMAVHGEMTGGGGGDGDGLSAAVPNACIDAVSGSIIARWQANTCLLASGKSLTMSGDLIRSSKRPAMVAGRNPYGKCQISWLTTLVICRKKLYNAVGW